MNQRALELADILDKQSVILSSEGMMRAATAVSSEAQQLRLLVLLG